MTEVSEHPAFRGGSRSFRTETGTLFMFSWEACVLECAILSGGHQTKLRLTVDEWDAFAKALKDMRRRSDTSPRREEKP